MGLFSFLKDAGAKVFTKSATSKAEDEETIRLREELAKRQKMIVLKGVVSSLGIPIKNLEMDVNGDKVTAYGQAPSQEAKEKIILAIGNVNGIGFVEDRISVSKPKAAAEFYTVKKGDTLGKISKHFYGDAMRYKEIFEANKPMLKDPNKIYPGQSLRIPKKK